LGATAPPTVVFPVMYVATVMCFQVFFIEETTIGWTGIDLTVSLIFAIDVLLNFNLAYFDSDGIIVKDRCACGSMIDHDFATREHTA
jgi:hypothetical protein